MPPPPDSLLGPAPRIVVVGDLDVTRRTCAALTAGGRHVAHLPRPTDTELAAALDPTVSAAAVLVRGDVTALRYALLIEHLRPGIRLVVTIFDRTVSEQLARAVPNCHVTSPADIAVPSIIGACLADDTVAVAAGPTGAVQIRVNPDGVVNVRPWRRCRTRRRSVVDALLRQARPHDATTRILLAGLAGLLVLLGTDWVIAVEALHEPSASALYDATGVIATVGHGNGDQHPPAWYLAFASAAMLATIGLTALFTAGVVNRLHSPRSVALVGARTLPTRDHVVIVGLGQVGLRLCIHLRQLGIPVLAVERDPRATNLRLAKQARVPVLVAHAEGRATLRRLRLHRARALAAMGSADLDNVEVAIAALAVAPALRIVLRAGENDVIAETRSLFHIGEVRDISALTSFAVTRTLTGQQHGIVYPSDDRIVSHAAPAGTESPAHPSRPHRCACVLDR